MSLRKLVDSDAEQAVLEAAITRRDYFVREEHRFPREDFLVRGALPRPAV